MFWECLLKGYLIGIILGVPAGAIGALTIKRTINHGLKGGFASGLGSCAADLIFAMTGIFGVRAISDFLTEHEGHIEIVGGIIIIGIGISFFFRKAEKKTPEELKGDSMVGFFASSFVAAILNPGTMVAFMLGFATFNVTDVKGMFDSVVLLLSIVLGTFSWWVVLCLIVNANRKKITESSYKKINIALGIIVIAFGLYIMIRGIVGAVA